jgi:HlyD family secretion protein
MPNTGTLTAIEVHVGEVVQAGQVLASQDTSALDAKLATDEANLATDEGTLQQEKSGSAAQQAQQIQTLKNQLTADQLQQMAAQQKLTETTSSSDASVAAAQAQIRIEQALLAADQQTYADDAPLCVSASPPASCATDQRQVQVDQGNLTAAQSALNQATADQQSSVTSAQDAVTQAASAVSSAQASLTAGSAPASPQSEAAVESQVQQDTAAIAADKQKLSQAVLTAPFSGVVSSVNGTVGEVATSQGVRQATPAQSLEPAATTGIQIFPQGPQTPTSTTPSSASLISLDSMQEEMVVQVPETQIGQIRVGQRAKATLPAIKGSEVPVVVSQIDRTPVVQSGQTYFDVDLVSATKGADELAYHPDSTGAPSSGSPMVGFTVDVDF